MTTFPIAKLVILLAVIDRTLAAIRTFRRTCRLNISAQLARSKSGLVVVTIGDLLSTLIRLSSLPVFLSKIHVPCTARISLLVAAAPADCWITAMSSPW